MFMMLHKQQVENSQNLNLCKEKGKEIVVEKMSYQQQFGEKLYMKRLQPLKDLSPKASDLKIKNLQHRMEMLDMEKLQLDEESSCNSSDGKQKESARLDEGNGTKDSQELDHLDPKRLRR